MFGYERPREVRAELLLSLLRVVLRKRFIPPV